MSLIENKKARFDFELLEQYEAGVELLGLEVKSLRNKRGTLEGSFVTIRGGEAYLLNSNIPPYQPSNTKEGYDPHRARKLLLKKKEIEELIGKERSRGLTLVPLAWYNKGTKLKLSFAVARGKKRFDKRESIKKRELDRETRRTLKTK